MPSLPKQPEGDAIAWSETPGAMQPVDAREVLQPRTTASKDNNTSLTLLQRLRRATVVILVALALPHGPSQAAPPELLVAVPVIHNPLSPNGEFIAGVRAYIGRVNTEGGVNGVPVRVVEVEQADIDTQFAQNLARILRSVPVAAILGCATAPACLVAKRMAQEHQLPLIAPLSSLPELTTGGAGTVFSLRAPLQDEVRALVNQLVQIGFTNVALVTEGPSVSAVDVALLDELRLRGIRATTIPAGSASDYAALPGHLAASSFHAAIVNVPRAAVEAMIDAGVAARSEWTRFVFTLSNGSLPSTLRAFKNRAIGFSEVVPNPESLSNPLVRQLALDAEKHGGGFLALSYPGMEGYLAAKLFADAPKQLPRGASARALAAVLARPDGWNLSGHLIGFSGGRVWGSRQVRLGVRTPGGGVTY